jgi:hypothetical protein
MSDSTVSQWWYGSASAAVARTSEEQADISTAITRQIEHKLLKRGFQFNVIVVGELGPLCLCS